MKRLFLVGFALASMVSVAPAVTIIDHFDDPAGNNAIFSGTAVVGTYNATQGPGLVGVLGGQRDYELVVTTASPPSATLVTQYSVGGLHLVSYENGPGVVSSLELSYGLGGPLNADFSADDFLTFRILLADFGGKADVTLTDGLSNWATVTEFFPATTSALSVSIPLSAFVGVDLSDVDLIQVKFSGPASWDLHLDAIETTLVPEPATAALLGLAGVPFLLFRRRRRRA